ncbi:MULTISPECIES: hypothetical protein [Streptomyces]|uniref:Uncharacterized protein n=1 Tax=Streptomyces cathayae TaxID=3031124 RepID=A0ABY8K7L5_9ACTN|nr:hypothetical protein [Streptomyces sp. HUAS 5]WGD42861.1 hypothetical protein PYS65_23495 [Streptomyces sp. HUAS 5]
MNSEKRQEAAPLSSRGHQTTDVTPRPGRPEREETRLPVGELALDVRREKRGIVMDHQDGFVWLRPEGGGTEWTALPGDVQPLNVRERAEGLMWTRVARANARSRGEVL